MSLSAADFHLVPLQRGVAGLIVPSKVYGIMAVGRSFLSAIEEDSHPAQIVREHRCGLRVAPDSPAELKRAIDWALNHPDELREMGYRGRAAVVKHFDRPISVGKFRTMIDALRPQDREFAAENRRDAANQIAY